MNMTKFFIALLTALFGASTFAQDVITYYHTDVTGSPIAATDASGNLVWREDFSPYGERLQKESAANANHMWFTGHHHDEQSGLTYAGARHYDPMIGRFMSVDPISPESADQFSFVRYVYANNNPYRYVDPSGMTCVGIGAASSCKVDTINRRPAGDVIGSLSAGLRSQVARYEQNETIAYKRAQQLGGQELNISIQTARFKTAEVTVTASELVKSMQVTKTNVELEIPPRKAGAWADTPSLTDTNVYPNALRLQVSDWGMQETTLHEAIHKQPDVRWLDGVFLEGWPDAHRNWFSEPIRKIIGPGSPLK